MLKRKNIILRALEPGDADLLFKWENDLETWKVSNTITPFSKSNIIKYANSVQDIYSEKQLRLMICLDRSGISGAIERNCTPTLSTPPIGCVDFFDFDFLHRRAGLGILIAEKESRGKGYASGALALVIQYAFRTLFLHQLYCNIPSNNFPSIKLFEKHNFKLTGHKKDWIKVPKGWEDELTYQLINH